MHGLKDEPVLAQHRIVHSRGADPVIDRRPLNAVTQAASPLEQEETMCRHVGSTPRGVDVEAERSVCQMNQRSAEGAAIDLGHP